MAMAKQTPTANDFMNAEVQTVPPGMTLENIVSFLLDEALSNVPVVKKSAKGWELMGFISERDCLAALSNEVFFGDPKPPQNASTIMRSHPVCVSASTDLFELASIFINHGFRHLPVTQGDTLKGIVSRRDVLRALDEYYR